MMSYCPNCGSQVEESMHFCPACGHALSSAEVTATVQPVIYQQTPVSSCTQTTAATDYSLVLISLGSCMKTSAQSLFRDMLGYSLADAVRITSAFPVQIACALNFQQALDLARIFTEYGMQIAIYNSTGYVDFAPYAETSVFNSSGSLLQSVLATVATVTAANKVQRFLKWTIPATIQNLFRPKYPYNIPPKYEHRPVRKTKTSDAGPQHRPEPAHNMPPKERKEQQKPSGHNPPNNNGPHTPGGRR